MGRVVEMALSRGLALRRSAEGCRRGDVVVGVAEESRLLGMGTEMVRGSWTGSARMDSVRAHDMGLVMQPERRGSAKPHARMGLEMVLWSSIAAVAALASETCSGRMLALVSHTPVVLGIVLLKLAYHLAEEKHVLASTQRILLGALE